MLVTEAMIAGDGGAEDGRTAAFRFLCRKGVGFERPLFKPL
jgi:hypothetical protein